MKKNNKKNSKKGALLVLLLLLAISVGYAALTTTLKINGNTKIKKATWDVHFANISAATKSEGATVVSAPAIVAGDNTANADQTVNFSVTLAEPGDFYEFTVDVVNGGTIPAKISDSAADILTVNGYEIINDEKSSEPIAKTTWEKYFKYTVEWSTEDEIQAGDKLAASATKTIKVRVEYDKNVNNAELPANDVEFDIALTMPFVQDK
ncbi:MAG: hypothetical protein IKO49_04380 [Bacilli bacterium]|nr:hypothetical protein [Bacilli bacterium]